MALSNSSPSHSLHQITISVHWSIIVVIPVSEKTVNYRAATAAEVGYGRAFQVIMMTTTIIADSKSRKNGNHLADFERFPISKTETGQMVTG